MDTSKPRPPRARLAEEAAEATAAPEPSYWQHVGLYAYRRSFALKFVSLARTERECSEGLAQLRALQTFLHPGALLHLELVNNAYY